MNFQKLSKRLFFVFLFLLPLQTAYLVREVFVGGEKWQYGVIAAYGTDILLFIAIVFAVIAKFSIADFRLLIADWHAILKSKIINHKSSALLVTLVLWAGLSIIWSHDQVLAAYSAFKLVLAAGAFFIARSLSDEERMLAIKMLIAGAVLESLLGTWQFLSQSTFASTLLGMSAHEVAEAGTSVLKGWHQRWLRAYGTLPHPNMLGGFLAAVLVMLVGRFEDFFAERKSFQKLLGAFAAVSILFGLAVTFSRSAWLGAAAGLALIAVAAYRKRMVLTLQLIGFLIVTMAVFAGLFHDLVGLRFDSAAIEREGSVSDRVQSLQDAKTVIGKENNIWNILLGTGIGNSTADMMLLQPSRPVWSIQPAHNVPILVFAELGLVGLVLFLGFLAAVILSAAKNLGILRQARNDNQGYSMVYIAAFIALMPALLLDHYLWTSHFGLLFFFVLLSFTARKS